MAKDILRRCVGIWSALTVSVIHAYDPRVIVFGGGVMYRHEAILPQIRAYVGTYAWLGGAEGKSVVSIVPSPLGPNAALLGSIPLLRANR